VNPDLDLILRDHPDGTDYRVVVRHGDPAARARHGELGFFDGWGSVTGQLTAFVEGAPVRRGSRSRAPADVVRVDAAAVDVLDQLRGSAGEGRRAGGLGRGEVARGGDPQRSSAAARPC